jgi:predicted dienelactone hydrolase
VRRGAPAALAAGVLAVTLAGCVASAATPPAAVRLAQMSRAGAADPAAARSHSPYAVGERIITFVDRSRTVRYPGEPPEPRTLVTVVRYPVAGPASRVDARNATPDRSDGPFPLIVFGHGFAVTPATYYRLLRAWAAAGYVVAAPVFPLENAHAPGGPDESDLVNQPRDMSVVISGMLAADSNPRALMAGTIDPRAVAVAGQSDGGETALAVAYDRYFRDPRIRAAVILSGAQIPGQNTLTFPHGAPALLAAQGTADTTNLPVNTYNFFRVARRPKYLLSLIDAEHLPPYTDEEPQLSIVERVSIDFFDRYLEGDRSGVAAMQRAGDRPGTTTLTADP